METKKVVTIAAAAGLLYYITKKKDQKKSDTTGLNAPATKKRKKEKVKDTTCRAYGSWMGNNKDPEKRSKGASKLASKTCKTSAQIKKGTGKIAEISKLAKKIRKENESWQSAIKRASMTV